jgi:hypothetical protein
MTCIGQLNEKPLHAALKAFFSHSVHPTEIQVGGYVIDVVVGEELIEIQTGNFSAIKSKLRSLVPEHSLRLVYPIPREKFLLKLPKPNWDGPKRRKSPKRGRIEEVFSELVSFPDLVCMENFTLEVLLIQEEEVRRYAGNKHWYRNGWEVVERKLLKIIDSRLFRSPADFLPYLPTGLPEAFTTADLARVGEMPRWLSQKMTYCLRKMGAIQQIGKKGRSYLYRTDLSNPVKEDDE